jgi:uncharacterized protein (DUF2141 family)
MPSRLRAVFLVCAGAIIGSAPLGLHAKPSPRGEIRFVVQVNGNDGQVACALFQKDDWLESTQKPYFARIKGKRAACVFADVAPGVYAISAFHDENKNGKLDTNLIGIPTEDWCTSRNASAFMGPPKFDDAKFDFKGGKLILHGRM